MGNNSPLKKKKKDAVSGQLPQIQHFQKGTNEARLLAAHQTTTYIGPIPPPEILTKYNEAVPDAAERILRMAETQSTHRQYIEKWAVIGGSVLAYVGFACALIIGLGSFYLSYLIIHEGNVISGSVIGGGSMVALVGTFIYGTRSRKQERVEKDHRNKELTRA